MRHQIPGQLRTNFRPLFILRRRRPLYQSDDRLLPGTQQTQGKLLSKEDIEALYAMRVAVGKLKTEPVKPLGEKATELIRKRLQLQFRKDLQQREAELKKVEERVKALRTQLDKRRTAQNDIISLKRQTILNEANGPGFPAGLSNMMPAVMSVSEPDRIHHSRYVKANDDHF